MQTLNDPIKQKVLEGLYKIERLIDEVSCDFKEISQQLFQRDRCLTPLRNKNGSSCQSVQQQVSYKTKPTKVSIHKLARKPSLDMHGKVKDPYVEKLVDRRV